jgi:hypothetical protein
MIVLKMLGFICVANAGPMQPLHSFTVEEAKEIVASHVTNLNKNLAVAPEDKARVLGPRGWVACNALFEHYKQRGLMNDADISIWRAAEAAPGFTASGRIFGIELLCGCFHPRSLIQVMDLTTGLSRSMKASDVRERRREIAIIHLSREARPANFVKTFSPIRATTHGKETFDLVVIHGSNGSSLRVTRNHGILVFPGIVKQAQDVSTKDQLFDIEGKLVSISALSSEAIEDEVVNFETNPTLGKDSIDEESPLEHIIFASGFAVGDLRWQNEYLGDIGTLLWETPK